MARKRAFLAGSTVLLALLAMPDLARGQSGTELISLTNTAWRYLDDRSDQGTNWRSRTFNDAVWAAGRGFFGQEPSLPYPYPEPVRTPLILGGGRITYYFRTHFNFSGSLAGVSLVASNFVDDGAVFYLNGVEAGRVRLTNHPVTVESLAQLNHPEGPVAVLLLGTNGLRQGDNVLAVEVHQHSSSSSDVLFGMSLHALASGAPAAIDDPAEPSDRPVQQGQATTLQVFASGAAPLEYQWFKDGAPVAGATTSTLTLENFAATNAGAYFARVSNFAGSVTSRTAIVSFAADTDPPRILYAIVEPGLMSVLVRYSEPVSVAEAEDEFLFVLETADGLGLGPSILDAVLADDSATRLNLGEAVNPSERYRVNVSGQRDLAGNAMPDGTIVLLAQEPVGLISMNGTYPWRYRDYGQALNTSWRGTNYDDAGWTSGLAPFDVFRSSVSAPPPFCRLTLPVINVPVQTCLSLSNPVASALVQTYYFRGQFVLPGNPTNAALRFRVLLDDGAVFYVNGAEIARVGMGTEPVDYSTFASRTVPQAGFEEFIAGAPALVAGTNVLAVEVHQSAANGLDATFGLELTALLTAPPTSGPRLWQSLLSDRITLTWQPPFGTLEAAADLDGPWGPISPSNPPNQHTADAIGAHRFYRVRSP